MKRAALLLITVAACGIDSGPGQTGPIGFTCFGRSSTYPVFSDGTKPCLVVRSQRDGGYYCLPCPDPADAMSCDRVRSNLPAEPWSATYPRCTYGVVATSL